MMATTRLPIPFIPTTDKSRSNAFNASRCVNMYPEQGQGKNNAYLLNTPGLELRKTLGDGPIRAAISTTNGNFIVSGDTVYNESTEALIGTISTSQGRVSLIDNGTELAVFEGDQAWYYTYSTSTFAEITDADFPGGVEATFIDGYGVFAEPDSGRFYITGLYAFSTIDALDFATAESKPDDVVTLIADNDELIIFGTETTQFYYNSGNADFPFDKYPGVMSRGCAAAGSVIADDNTIFFLGDDLVLYRMQNRSPVRISSNIEEYQIAKMPRVDDAIAFSYTDEGHKFYVITFPSGNKTYVYDVATNRGHERETYGKDYWRAGTYVKIGNDHVVGDLFSGNLYNMKTDVYTDNSIEIVRKIIFPSIHRNRNDYIHNLLELDFEFGVGLETGDGSDPKGTLYWSDDGQDYYGGVEFSLGKIGDYDYRAEIFQLGIASRRDYKIEISHPVKIALIGAHLELEECFR